jgi:capsular polysaccharide transport system permease protein
MARIRKKLYSRWKKCKRAVASTFTHFSFTWLALVATLLAAFYWSFIASDRYVSEAHVIVQLTNTPGGSGNDLSALLGSAGNGSRSDQMLLRDYLLSVDMLTKLDAELKLRSHYSSQQHDLLSRMWQKEPSIEWFHRYFLSRVSVEYDDYDGVLVVNAQGYDRQTAHAITSFMLREGERFMNTMAHELAQEQVKFLEKETTLLGERAILARQAVLAYQNSKGLIAPLATAQSLSAIVAKLESERTELQTRISALQAYLVPTHPNIIQLQQELDAVDKQIAREQAKLATPAGGALNNTVEEIQRLEMEAGFAQEIFKGALVALEKSRVEATRNLKKVSILQEPTSPGYAVEPRRLYNTIVFALAAALLAGLLNLLIAIVRDHKD